MIPTARPFFKNRKKILKRIDGALKSGRLMNGKMCAAFEDKFARYIGSKHAIAVNSCTVALETVLRFIDVKDKEVIAPTNTFVATANAVIFAGGTPVLADVKKYSYTVDPAEIRRKITKKTKAVIIVHIAGIPCEDVNEIRNICDSNKIFLIEDCAHAVGASFGKKKAGTFGLAGCFSFYPTKIMTTGTGGMITTDSGRLNSFARSVICHGSRNGMSNIVNIGNDWFMDEIRAAVGLSQLEEVDSMIRKRRAIASSYTGKLRANKKIGIYPVPEKALPGYYKFPVQLLDGNVDPEAFKKLFLKKYGVDLESVYWPTCHLQPVYKRLFGFKKGDFPVAESALSRQICLPIHPLISGKDIDFIVSKLEAELCA